VNVLARLNPLATSPTDSGRAGRFSKKRFLQGLLVGLLLVSVYAYLERDRYAHQFADTSRALIGDENTARIESWYFAVQDRIDKTKYQVFGGSTNPFNENDGAGIVAVATETEGEAAETPESGSAPAAALDAPAAPTPLLLPHVTHLQTNPEQGEGVWTTAGLPHSSPDDVLMAKTFIRPDTSRPYAVAGILLIDQRRVRLHIVGGKESPGGDLGVHGPGVIPDEDRAALLVAWNGGFRGPHGGFGMYADGVQYRPLRDGFASVAVMKDGSILMGQWGRDLAWNDDMVAVRQNAIMLVENCKVSDRTNEGNETWGYVDVNTSEFITWRSAIGLTEEGNLIVAAGNSLSADSLAHAMQSAGACSAMQLDINSPYVLTSLYFQQPDGSIESARFMDSMGDNPARFLGNQDNDFMYVTLTESNHVP
jgi:Phosphodiester glycosidase